MVQFPPVFDDPPFGFPNTEADAETHRCLIHHNRHVGRMAMLGISWVTQPKNLVIHDSLRRFGVSRPGKLKDQDSSGRLYVVVLTDFGNIVVFTPYREIDYEFIVACIIPPEIEALDLIKDPMRLTTVEVETLLYNGYTRANVADEFACQYRLNTMSSL